MSAPVVSARRERLADRIVLTTLYAIDKGGSGYFEIHLGRSAEDTRPVIYATRDRELYRKALAYEDDACPVDAWVIAGRPKDTTAHGVLVEIRLAESE